MVEEQQQETGLDQVEEDYAVWKKNTLFLYDMVISHPLEWLSLTVHWVPLPIPLPYPSNPSLVVHKLVLGTHTSEGFPNFLMVVDALLPCNESKTNTVCNAENPKNIQNKWAEGILCNTENLTKEKMDEVLKEFLKDFKEGSLIQRVANFSICLYSLKSSHECLHKNPGKKIFRFLHQLCVPWLCQDRRCSYLWT